jgi:hypothetical protein
LRQKEFIAPDKTKMKVVFESNPIGFFTRGWKARQRIKDQYQKYQSDLTILVPSGKFHGFLIELKRDISSARLSDGQRLHLENAKKLGYLTAVVRNLQDFKKYVNHYLKNKAMKAVEEWCNKTY